MLDYMLGLDPQLIKISIANSQHVFTGINLMVRF